jgi:hypothetical protein
MAKAEIRHLRALASVTICIVLWCIASAASGQAPPSGAPVVRQVDHIMVTADSIADAKTLWLLFIEKLQLPVAWPPAQYENFFSGGVNLGNVNLEFVYFNDSATSGHPPARRWARFSGIELEPEPLAVTIPELDRRHPGSWLTISLRRGTEWRQADTVDHS